MVTETKIKELKLKRNKEEERLLRQRKTLFNTRTGTKKGKILRERIARTKTRITLISLKIEKIKIRLKKERKK